MDPGGRDVGRIGLQHQALGRQAGGQAADVAGTVEGHGPAEADGHAQTDEMLGLLRAAVEGMGNAAGGAEAPQLLGDGIHRATGMQDDG